MHGTSDLHTRPGSFLKTRFFTINVFDVILHVGFEMDLAVMTGDGYKCGSRFEETTGVGLKADGRSLKEAALLTILCRSHTHFIG